MSTKLERIVWIVHLSCLGWTQEEVAKAVGLKSQGQVSEIIGNIDVNKIDNFYSAGKSIEQNADTGNCVIRRDKAMARYTTRDTGIQYKANIEFREGYMVIDPEHLEDFRGVAES